MEAALRCQSAALRSAALISNRGGLPLLHLGAFPEFKGFNARPRRLARAAPGCLVRPRRSREHLPAQSRRPLCFHECSLAAPRENFVPTLVIRAQYRQLSDLSQVRVGCTLTQ
jgi:hypothetical protein